MTAIAASLGIAAFLNLAAASCCAAMPTEPSAGHGDHESPADPTEKPTACHATQNCAEHRRIRSIT
jgi:hypothetical protein